MYYVLNTVYCIIWITKEVYSEGDYQWETLKYNV